MANMAAELYDAFRDAGAPDEKARAAKIEADSGLLKWMVGLNMAMTLAILVRLFAA